MLKLGHKWLKYQNCVKKIAFSRICSIRDRTVAINGANIFNAMPRIIREYQGDFPGFKIMVDTFLMEVPDCPILDGYTSHNMDRSNKPSNSLIDWCDNMNVINWVPGSLVSQD